MTPSRSRHSVELLVLVSVAIFAVLTSTGPAAGQTVPRCNPCQATGGGNSGTIDVVVRRGVSDRVPGRGDASYGEAPGRTEWRTVEEQATPTCTGNGVDGTTDVCAAALTTCPADDQVRYWIWHRVTEHQLGPPRTSTVGQWVQEPGSYCLGPDDPGVPDIGRVIAQVQTAFQSLPLPVATTTLNPAPRTLVNVPTRLDAGSAEPQTFDPVLLGIRVTITATPSAWEWTFGDGTGATTAVPRTEHVYRRAATVGASVRVTWNGTFTVGGSAEVFTIRTPAYVQGPVTPLDVRTARTELVAD